MRVNDTDTLLVKTHLQEMDRFGYRGYFICSGNGRTGNTMFSTTRTSVYCIGFVYEYPCYPVRIGFLALCTCVVFCSDRLSC